MKFDRIYIPPKKKVHYNLLNSNFSRKKNTDIYNVLNTKLYFYEENYSHENNIQ